MQSNLKCQCSIYPLRIVSKMVSNRRHIPQPGGGVADCMQQGIFYVRRSMERCDFGNVTVNNIGPTEALCVENSGGN